MWICLTSSVGPFHRNLRRLRKDKGRGKTALRADSRIPCLNIGWRDKGLSVDFEWESPGGALSIIRSLRYLRLLCLQSSEGRCASYLRSAGPEQRTALARGNPETLGRVRGLPHRQRLPVRYEPIGSCARWQPRVAPLWKCTAF